MCHACTLDLLGEPLHASPACLVHSSERSRKSCHSNHSTSLGYPLLSQHRSILRCPCKHFTLSLLPCQVLHTCSPSISYLWLFLLHRCIECGFCESNCPSKDLSMTPRQRITVYREMHRLKTLPSASVAESSRCVSQACTCQGTLLAEVWPGRCICGERRVGPVMIVQRRSRGVWRTRQLDRHTDDRVHPNQGPAVPHACCC